ncbi:phage tail assembly protein [Novosphingobium rosa]|uniref:phage tail assembly protein n=1 Tax=Novosphingobium rosa TaxID=76978 RepID=UPI00082C10DB|nr:phage tail assembly protein [Novosphingobium rosa]
MSKPAARTTPRAPRATPSPVVTSAPADAAELVEDAEDAEPAQPTGLVTLSYPIERKSGKTVATLSLRVPLARELATYDMFDLINGDVDSIIDLVPRIADPFIHASEVEKLRWIDLSQCSTTVIEFFLVDSDKLPSTDPLTINLIHPLQTEAGPVESITLREPDSGAIRGLKLPELANCRIGSMLTLLPRIALAKLKPAEVGTLHPVDLYRLGKVIAGFFLTAEQRAERDQRMQMALSMS